MKTIRCSRCIFALFFMAFGGASCANERIYTVGVEDFEDFLPYSQYNKGIYSGLGKDILELFAKKNGYTFVYKPYPVKRRDFLFFSGSLDFQYPDNPYWVAHEKEGLNIKYAPILPFTDGVVVLPKNKGKGIEHLKKLAMPIGFTPFKYLGLIGEGKIKIFEAYRYTELYNYVQRERVDGAYVNTQVAKYHFSQYKNAGDMPIVFDRSLPYSTGFHCISSIKYPKIISEIEAFLKDEKNKAVIDELKRAHKFEHEELI